MKTVILSITEEKESPEKKSTWTVRANGQSLYVASSLLVANSFVTVLAKFCVVTGVPCEVLK